MDDQQLGDWLKAAFEPYVRGFCQTPNDACLTVTIHSDRIDGDALLGASDFQAIAGDVHVARALKEGFSALCRKNDLTRGASLAFRRQQP